MYYIHKYSDEQGKQLMGIITVIGAGMMGAAITFPASDNGNEVRLVGTPLDREIIQEAMATGVHKTLKRKLPEGLKYYQIGQAREALCGAELFVCGVSSFGAEWFGQNIIPMLPENLPVLSVTKGMHDDGDGMLTPFPEVYEKRFPEKSLNISAVGGPCISYELADRLQTQVCFCGKDMHTLRMIKAMFATPYYHIRLSDDVAGVECAVALKNAYAMGVALAMGLSEGKPDNYNAQAALLGQSIREMGNLIRLCGGREESVVYGAGDLYVTICRGRSRSMGILLGKGYSFDEAMKELGGLTIEAVVIAETAAAAVRNLEKRGAASAAEFPLLIHLDSILRGKACTDIPWEKFEV